MRRLNALGIAGKQRGDFDAAAAAYRQALTIIDRMTGDPGADDVRATLLHNRAGLAHAAGDPAAAEPLARAGLALRLATSGDPLAVATDRAALAAILVDLGRFAEARELLAAVIGEFERRQETYELAVALHNLGSLEHKVGQQAAALGHLQRSLDLKHRQLGHDHVDLAITWHNLGCVQAASGRAVEAAASFEQALRLLAPAVAPDHPTLLACRRRLAAARTAALA